MANVIMSTGIDFDDEKQEWRIMLLASSINGSIYHVSMSMENATSVSKQLKQLAKEIKKLNQADFLCDTGLL